jgi:hypothetical protein
MQQTEREVPNVTEQTCKKNVSLPERPHSEVWRSLTRWQVPRRFPNFQATSFFEWRHSGLKGENGYDGPQKTR